MRHTDILKIRTLRLNKTPSDQNSTNQALLKCLPTRWSTIRIGYAGGSVRKPISAGSRLRQLHTLFLCIYRIPAVVVYGCIYRVSSARCHHTHTHTHTRAVVANQTERGRVRSAAQALMALFSYTATGFNRRVCVCVCEPFVLVRISAICIKLVMYLCC